MTSDRENPLSLLILPPEILSLLPAYLADIEDFVNLLLTCRQTNSLRHTTSPSTLLRLSHASRLAFFRPDPLFLLSALSPAISTYSHASEPNRQAVKRAIWGGTESLLLFAVNSAEIANLARWSFGRIRDLWEWRIKVMDPVMDLIDKCAGKQWSNKVEGFWLDEGSNPRELICAPSDTFCQLVIYGELFGKGMREWLKRNDEEDPPDGIESDKRPFVKDPRVHPADSVSFRLDFVKYCIIDRYTLSATRSSEAVHSSYPPSPGDYFAGDTDDRFHSLVRIQRDYGPYVEAAEASTGGNVEDIKVILLLLTEIPLWNMMWQGVRLLAGGDFSVATWFEDDEVHREQEVWENYTWLLGLDGMEMVADVWKACLRRQEQGGLFEGWGSDPNDKFDWLLDEVDASGQRWQALRAVRQYIEKIEDEEPRLVMVGNYDTFEFPFLRGDLSVTLQRS